MNWTNHSSSHYKRQPPVLIKRPTDPSKWHQGGPDDSFFGLALYTLAKIQVKCKYRLDSPVLRPPWRPTTHTYLLYPTLSILSSLSRILFNCAMHFCFSIAIVAGLCVIIRESPVSWIEKFGNKYQSTTESDRQRTHHFVLFLCNFPVAISHCRAAAVIVRGAKTTTTWPSSRCRPSSAL